jgi:ATP-binding cassette subfamily F protein uup
MPERVVRLTGVALGYGERLVLEAVDLEILEGEVWYVIGPNGSGKTTLLRLLTGELEPDSGEVRRGGRVSIAYFDQQRQQLDPERTVVESVADTDTITINGQPKHVLGYLADFLFPRERALSPVKALSGGERNRLLLARLFAQPANVLVLDEPTNDLDIETLELLEELLDTFDGTVLLVTHDREFLDNVVTSVIAMEDDGRIAEYVGGWQDYLRQAPRAAAPDRSGDAAHPRQAVARASDQAPALRRKKTNKEAREYAVLPDRIAALEDEQRRLQQEAASPDFYREPAERIQFVLARIEAIHDELERVLARWLTLEDIGR